MSAGKPLRRGDRPPHEAPEPKLSDHVEIGAMNLPDPHGWRIDVKAGKRGVEIMQKGTPDEHEQIVWARRVEVYISPTGRSIRVFVDGEEIKS